MPAGIYIHIPFCLSKCYYCDFYSKPASDEEINEYVECLIKEIKIVLPRYSEKKFDTIYIGGGTPSILKIIQLENIFKTLFKFINPSDIVETTLEANPETLTQGKLKALKKIGINRLSIGIQSTHNHLLKLLNRVHNKKKAIESIELARKAGFNNLNVDLIFGIPQQTMKDWDETLDTVTFLRPEHLSVYNLTVEKGTKLYNLIKTNQLQLPDEDLQIRMFKYAMKLLPNRDYKHYEISNYALDEFSCKHNLKYWQGDEYLGIGVASHSWMNGKRFYIPRNIKLYMENVKRDMIPYRYDKVRGLRRRIAEKLMLGLRLISGISTSDFQKNHNIDLLRFFSDEIKELKDMELISINKTRMKLTKKGILLSNEVMSKFF